MISVAIIAVSKEVIRKDCLESAQKISDDVVIVTNQDHEFINYSEQKNFAASKCKNDWILSLDSDEVISANLVEELRTMNYQLSAYYIPRKNIIFGKTINHTNWDPDGVLRLYRKSKAKFEGQVHEQLVVDGSVGRLKSPIIHYNYSRVEEFLDKMNKYSSMETSVTSPVYDFLRRYIWHAGFLDGWHGLFLSYLQAIYHIEVWVKRRLSSRS